MSARCGDCRFFGNLGYDRGPCRRYPPQRDNDMTSWPSVHASEWCGEYKQRVIVAVAEQAA